jgi:hypothetical protein
MKHLKKYNESKEDDIFSDESILHDILLEYVECGAKYTIKPKSFKIFDIGVDFIPIAFNGDISNDPSIYKGCQISFTKFFNDGYYATDVQRGENQKLFSVPKNNLYRFFEITKDVQYRIESMGYIFLLSTHKDTEFDFMIIENK